MQLVPWIASVERQPSPTKHVSTFALSNSVCYTCSGFPSHCDWNSGSRLCVNDISPKVSSNAPPPKIILTSIPRSGPPPISYNPRESFHVSIKMYLCLLTSILVIYLSFLVIHQARISFTNQFELLFSFRVISLIRMTCLCLLVVCLLNLPRGCRSLYAHVSLHVGLRLYDVPIPKIL